MVRFPIMVRRYGLPGKVVLTPWNLGCPELTPALLFDRMDKFRLALRRIGR